MKIPKGGLHNINQSSQANINDSWNVLATDENNAVLIAVDKCGTKKTVGDTTEIKNSIQALEQKNIEQDGRLENLEGIHYTWSPTNRTLTLYDNNGNQLSQVSLQSLDNEGTAHTHNISDVANLQTTLYNKENISNKQNNLTADVTNTKYPTVTAVNDGLTTKQKKLSSFDESILIETDGNIEGNVSLFTEYFNTKNCILGFTPIQVLGVYKNGLKLLQSEYTITLPKTISINTYIDENIEIQYTHLKS